MTSGDTSKPVLKSLFPLNICAPFNHLIAVFCVFLPTDLLSTSAFDLSLENYFSRYKIILLSHTHIQIHIYIYMYSHLIVIKWHHRDGEKDNLLVVLDKVI